MNTKHETHAYNRPIVYVRPVDVEELPADAQAKLQDRDQIWAVHAETGDRLALVADRKLADVLARQNNMELVTLH